MRRSKTILGLGALRLDAPFRALLRPGRDVLPVYHPQRPGWSVALRKGALLGLIVVLAFLYGVMAAILPPGMLVGAAAPLALLALLVVWALPDAKAAPTRALTHAFTAFVLFMILWPNYLAVSVAGLPWISMRRLVGLILTALLMICLSTSKPFRQGMADVFRTSPWLSRLLIGFIIIQFLASIFSVSPGETIGRWVNTTFTSTAVCFTTIWLFGPGGKTVPWLVNRLAIAVFVLMVIGVFEARAQHVLWLEHIPSFLRIDDAVLSQLIQPHIRNWYRVVTTYTTPLAYGELLALTTPFVLYRMVNAKTWPIRLFWLAFDVFVFYSAVLSTARLALVGFLAAHAVFGLLWGLHRWRNARGDLIGISATMMYPAVLVALALAVLFVPALHVRVLGGGAAQASTDARSAQFHMAMPVIARRPLLGYGPGEGGGAINWRTPEGILTIDLGFVALAADVGVFGFLAYVGVILLSIIGLFRIGWRDFASPFPPEFAIVVSLTVLISTRLVLAQGDNDPLFMILFGLSLAMLYAARGRDAGNRVVGGTNAIGRSA
ncbi:O-antigen ligase family protein [Sphingomonas trueperi]|uniref:O-antigen ligase family protein n=1 Tax=Sphingomonas trueperi TaxID=53317 RepID=UPI000EAC843E